MKLLLTSGGITNKSIAEALWELVGKKPEDTSLVFVPTASNVEVGDKGWLIEDLKNLQKQNFRSIDIADISALPKEVWLPKFQKVYILDDTSAVKVIDKKVEVISEGEYITFDESIWKKLKNEKIKLLNFLKW